MGFIQASLKKAIESVVQAALPTYSKEAVQRIVEHLLSDDVGVTAVEDLRDVTSDMLPTSLPPLKAKQLLRAFQGNQGWCLTFT